MSAAPDLEITRVGRTALAVFNRPTKANALTIAMQQALCAHLAEIADDASCDGIVINGGEAKVFSAGADFRETDDSMASEDFADLRSGAFFDMLAAVLACPRPVVVALNGHAVGSGCLLALVADARVAVPEATLSLPEIARGQPTFAGAAVVSHRMTDVLAGDLVQSGRRMGMDEARHYGLLAGTIDRAQLIAAATAEVEKLARHGDAFALNKGWINGDLADRLGRARARSADVRRNRLQR